MEMELDLELTNCDLNARCTMEGSEIKILMNAKHL